MTEVGKKIKEIRIKRGLSQENLAESAKINLRTIQRIENNETKPRGKTLQLIFDALDIEVIEHEKTTIDKYLIWSSLLTLLIIVGTFIGWFRRFEMYYNGEKIYITFTGWEGDTSFFHNWLVSISCISVGFIVIGHSFGLLKNKLKYIVLQIIILFIYILAAFEWSSRQDTELRPGLFIVVIATILLVRAYRKKDRKTGTINTF